MRCPSQGETRHCSTNNPQSDAGSDTQDTNTMSSAAAAPRQQSGGEGNGPNVHNAQPCTDTSGQTYKRPCCPGGGGLGRSWCPLFTVHTLLTLPTSFVSSLDNWLLCSETASFVGRFAMERWLPLPPLSSTTTTGQSFPFHITGGKKGRQSDRNAAGIPRNHPPPVIPPSLVTNPYGALTCGTMDNGAIL